MMVTMPAVQGQPPRGDKPLGRPRCRVTQGAILDTAAALLGRERYRDITIERIAAEAGVGKQTIYRWYDSKAELMLEAYMARVSEAVPQVESDDPVADLRAYVHALVDFLPDPSVSGAYRALLAEAQFDAVFRSRFRAVVLERRRDGARRLMEAAMAAGHLGGDPDILLDMIFGPILWRFATSTEAPDRAYADAVLDQVLGVPFRPPQKSLASPRTSQSP